MFKVLLDFFLFMAFVVLQLPNYVIFFMLLIDVLWYYGGMTQKQSVF